MGEIAWESSESWKVRLCNDISKLEKQHRILTLTDIITAFGSSWRIPAKDPAWWNTRAEKADKEACLFGTDPLYPRAVTDNWIGTHDNGEKYVRAQELLNTMFIQALYNMTLSDIERMCYNISTEFCVKEMKSVYGSADCWNRFTKKYDHQLEGLFPGMMRKGCACDWSVSLEPYCVMPTGLNSGSYIYLTTFLKSSGWCHWIPEHKPEKVPERCYRCVRGDCRCDVRVKARNDAWNSIMDPFKEICEKEWERYFSSESTKESLRSEPGLGTEDGRTEKPFQPAVGDHVILSGLVSRTQKGEDLNGQQGKVTKYLSDRQRWAVLLKNGKRVSVKALNMTSDPEAVVARRLVENTYKATIMYPLWSTVVPLCGLIFISVSLLGYCLWSRKPAPSETGDCESEECEIMIMS